MSRSITATRVSAAAAVIVTLAFWVAFVAAARMEDAYDAAAAKVVKPIPLNGMLFTPEGLSRLGAHLQGRQNMKRPHTLVFVLADSCDACVRATPAWLEFLAKASLDGMSLTFISAGGESLVSQLAGVVRSRALSFESYRLIDDDAFIYSTGVLSTPRILLLDEQSRLRYMTPHLDERAEADIVALVGRARSHE